MIRVTCPSHATVTEVRLCLARGSLAPHNCSHVAHGCYAREASMAPVLRLDPKRNSRLVVVVVVLVLLVGISVSTRFRAWPRGSNAHSQGEAVPLVQR